MFHRVRTDDVRSKFSGFLQRAVYQVLRFVAECHGQLVDFFGHFAQRAVNG